LHLALLVLALTYPLLGAEPAANKVDKAVASGQHWYFAVDALVLTRADALKDFSLFGDNGGSTGGNIADDTSIFSSQDMELDDWSPTARLTFGYCFDDKNGIEASYFGFGLLSMEQSSKTFQDAASDFDVPLAFDTNDFDGIARAKFKYRSDFNHNGELSYKRHMVSDGLLAGSSLMGGVRVMNIDEEFTIFSSDQDPDIFSKYRVKTSNLLVGGQIGGKARFNPCRKFTIDVWGKAGAFANMAKQDTLMTDFANTVALRDYSDSVTKLAFVGELGLNLEGQIHKNVFIHGGYQAIFVNGIALAPENLDFVGPVTHRKSVDCDGDAIYHGAFLGVKVKF
jgi:hypothetical protein